MFEIGWTEMLVIAIVMIVVVGPKDLPKMLRTVGKTVAKLRGMAGDFQKQFNEALKEADLDDVKKSFDDLRGLNPAAQIKKQLNPFEKAAADVRAGLDAAMKPKPDTAAQPAAAETHAAVPLKDGATEMAGSAAPDAVTKPQPSAAPAAPAETHAAAPLKNGATAMAGVAAPRAMPLSAELSAAAPKRSPGKRVQAKAAVAAVPKNAAAGRPAPRKAASAKPAPTSARTPAKAASAASKKVVVAKAAPVVTAKAVPSPKAKPAIAPAKKSPGRVK